jgi:4-amino-4-deoxy-L-arabinose transferase-like glycosyltransferase
VPRASLPDARRGPDLGPWLVGGALVAILIGAALLRFIDLGSNPGGMFADEAYEGYDAQQLLHVAGFHPLFFTDGGGREALFAYLVAAVFRFAGETSLALRATAAGIGVAGVVAIWLLARRLGVAVGLAAAAWAAGSLWLICVSRDGMRNTLVPLFGALALAALIAWHDRPNRRMAVLAGAASAAATLYAYQPLKLLPLLVLVWLLWLRRADRAGYDRMRGSLVAFTVAFLVIGLPMLAVAVAEPGVYLGRALGTVVGDGSVVDHWLRTLGMFAVTGDPNQRHDVDGLPLLGIPLSIPAALGVGRLWRARRDGAQSLILLSLPVFLLAPLIATEGGAPHFLRSLGLAAPLGVAIGLGVAELIGLARATWGTSAARLMAVAAAALLVALGAASGAAYLARPIADRYAAYSYDLVAMAAASRDPRDAVIVDDYSSTVIRFLDAGHLPVVVVPSTRIRQPAAYRQLFALRLADLSNALGPSAARHARVVATNPAGQPTVWAVTP